MGSSVSHEIQVNGMITPDSMDTESEYQDEEPAETMPVRGVTWDEPDTDDYDTQYTGASRIQSSYGSRLKSARGRRAQLGSAATGMSEFNDTLTDLNSEILELDEYMTSEEGEAGVRAPSLAFWYNDDEVGDILTQDVYVPAHGLTKHTFYCCLQWNGGRDGGGYCGIQDHPNGRNYIFSLWNPTDSEENIKPVYAGPGTICEPFGGEDEGLKSWNFTIGWEPDYWYTLVTRRWDHDQHTYFGFWIKHQMTLEWTHVVTVDYPMEDIYFETLTCSFLEDWEGSGENLRRVHFKNGYKRGLTGKWVPFTQAAFSIVKELASKTYEDNINSGALDDTFFLQSGGETFLTDDVENGTTFERNMPSRPDVNAICCYITAVTDDEITWEIPSGSVPQFQYIIYVDRVIIKQEINSEARICRFRTAPQEIVELLVEDIYGKTVKSSFELRFEKVRTPLRRRCDVYVPSVKQAAE